MWETSAPGAYCTIECPNGSVSIWALGEERRRVELDGDVSLERVVVGHGAAHVLAHEFARQIGGQ